MRVYGENERRQSVYAWNTVDVLVDGLLQHGEVVDVAENGLIIDFGCEAHRAEFIEYGRIFHSQSPFDPLDTTFDTRVQVLLRACPDHLWKWYPGRVVPQLPSAETYLSSLSIVEVQLPHGVIQEVLPKDQIRRSPSEADLARRCVGENDYIIRDCPLPAAWSEEAPLLQELCKMNSPSVRCTTVHDGMLYYVQRYSIQPALYPLELGDLYLELKRQLAAGELSPGLVGGHLITVDTVSEALEQCFIPCELVVLTEIIGLLDSVNRTRFRRTCALWNTIITDASLSDVLISGQKEDVWPTSRQKPLFWILACVLHCVNNRTKKVALEHMSLTECDAAAEMIRYVLGGSNRVETLEFRRCALRHPEDWSLAATMGCLQRICGVAQRACWIQCRIAEQRLTAVWPQESVVCQPEEQLETQLWDLFEKLLVTRIPIHLTTLKAWVTRAAMHPVFKRLARVLHEYQSVDPRSSTEYRGWQWTVPEMLHLEVAKLTSVTAAAVTDLLERQNYGSIPKRKN
ncbi:uncharacterized protein LOC129599088 [Paramacrobiotus metropolitanus]|uniref:uncharacterized protein LOC129599088 n=1 Tax=Paramacrobiotus metropolitanus TaxID=2943436 RepID=UPI0024464E1B|nr:uncharacterized protein LOC129599088 [Paramacrobiotus metropolitanus]